MAVLRLKETVKNSVLSPIQVALDAGAAGGAINIYNGTIPATPETAITTQTLLGTLTLADPCGAVSGGVLTMGAITQDSSADASGTASWARLTDSNGNVVMDIDVSNTGGGGTLQLNTVNIVAGGPILISSFVVRVA